MNDLVLPRRRFLFGAVASLFVAPAVIRVAKLMPISVQPELWYYSALDGRRASSGWRASGTMYARSAEEVKQILYKKNIVSFASIPPVISRVALLHDHRTSAFARQLAPDLL